MAITMRFSIPRSILPVCDPWPQWLAEELKLAQCPLNIRVVSDIKPYKERKVAILNGAHTALVPVAWLCGLETVGEAMQDADVRRFVERAISEEIIPVLDLPADELREFADAVSGRFQNPYIRHQLLSIALNGMTKFRTRILPGCWRVSTMGAGPCG